jgi:hypothetical protein
MGVSMFDSKSIAASIVDGEKPESEEVAATDDELAAEDVMAAFQENDPKALATALRAFFTEAEAAEPDEVEAEA